MLSTFRKCCCCDLKWGALIVAIIDMMMTAAVVLETKYLAYSVKDDDIDDDMISFDVGPNYFLWIGTLIIHFVHLVACVFVMISVWMQFKNLIIPYLIIGIIRFVYDSILLVYVCVELGPVYLTLLLILSGLGAAIFFWFVAYSWFKMLGESSSAN
ncbi:uncharacterized protein LOC108087787 [Drosophila ficusphila]|uniref:uncharacterized protein LOC108087787 n=1 Tax=Drosophila ficusphila TaxID=30025 RepID=UPI0007E80B3A|nr:uncharacterized protein LOC108087787 [Drosophila ficusphila]